MKNNSDFLKKNDLSKMHLKGNIKLLTESKYGAIDQFGKSIKGDLLRKELICFNELGNIIEEKNHWTSDNFESKSTKEYDDKGILIEVKCYKLYESLYIFESKSVYLYDIKGRMIEYRCYHPSNSKYEEDTCDLLSSAVYFEYDLKGNMIKEKNQYFQIENEYVYDENGNLITVMSRNWDEYTDSMLYRKNSFTYDDKGNNIEQVEYNTDGRISRKQIIKYDDGGIVIEHETYMGNGFPIHRLGQTIHKYDSKGNKTEENHFTEMISYQDIYTYDYDDKGNWIIKNQFYTGPTNMPMTPIVTINYSPRYIIEREILYF
jgi:hypothetical protein